MQNMPELWGALRGGCGGRLRWEKPRFWRVYDLQTGMGMTIRPMDLHRCNRFQEFLHECKKERRPEGTALRNSDGCRRSALCNRKVSGRFQARETKRPSRVSTFTFTPASR